MQSCSQRLSTPLLTGNIKFMFFRIFSLRTDYFSRFLIHIATVLVEGVGTVYKRLEEVRLMESRKSARLGKQRSLT